MDSRFLSCIASIMNASQILEKNHCNRPQKLGIFTTVIIQICLLQRMRQLMVKLHG